MSEEISIPIPDEKMNVPGEALSEAQKIKKGICPSCDGGLVFQEGCKVCFSCGWGGCE
jgi:alkyl hydroperoxide reductase subunit AhpF